MYSVKDVNIFKPFGQKDLSNFNLVKISEIYDNLENLQENNKQLVFLDEAGNENLKEMKRLLVEK